MHFEGYPKFIHEAIKIIKVKFYIVGYTYLLAILQSPTLHFPIF